MQRQLNVLSKHSLSGGIGYTMDKLRIGIIGVGGMSRFHIKSFIDSPDAEVVGLVDTDPERLKTAVEMMPELDGVPAYSDYSDMLAAGGLDATQINTPHTLHFDQIMDSLDAGLHVLTEKPMVCSAAHARAIIEKARSTGKVVQIAYQRHFQSDTDTSRTRLQTAI